MKLMDDEILAVVQPSAPRRGFGVAVLAGLGMILIYVALSRPPANIFWGAFLLGMGGFVLWGAYRMRMATRGWLELTATELRTNDGVTIARVADIRSLDRGMFAFKPSNGFMLRLNAKTPRSWHPGLWWSLGDRVGVGGVTSAHQTKAMAEIIAAMIAVR